MIDPASVLISAVLVGAGVLLGRLTRRAPADTTVKPVCACTHILGAHDDAKGRCLAEGKREHYDKHGLRAGFEWVPCACRKYTGPEPLPEYWAPPPLT